MIKGTLERLAEGVEWGWKSPIFGCVNFEILTRWPKGRCQVEAGELVGGVVQAEDINL